jgi:hypothetical protein
MGHVYTTPIATMAPEAVAAEKSVLKRKLRAFDSYFMVRLTPSVRLGCAGPRLYSDGKQLRIVTLGISGGRSLTRPFRDARRFPSTRL